QRRSRNAATPAAMASTRPLSSPAETMGSRLAIGLESGPYPRGARAIGSIAGRAMRVGAGLGQAAADLVAHVGIDLGELVIDAAGLRAAVEPDQRLAEIIKAVRGALAARVLLIIGQQDAGRGRRLVVVEIGAALEVADPARPATAREARRRRFERGLRLGIMMLVPQPEARIVGALGVIRIGGRGARRRRGRAGLIGPRPGRGGGGRLRRRADGRLEPLDPRAQLRTQAGDLLLERGAAMARFLDLAGQGAQLRLDRVNPGREVRQGVAGQGAARRGAGLGADLGLDELGVAAGEDAPLDRAQLLLEPVDPTVERLGDRKSV